MKDYQQSTTNWRANLRANEKKTKLVIACFVGLYILLGLLVDIFFLMQNNNYTISSALISLLTFHNPPFATIIMLIIAGISLLVTYSMYDKMMLLGTDSHQVLPNDFNL